MGAHAGLDSQTVAFTGSTQTDFMPFVMQNCVTVLQIETSEMWDVSLVLISDMLQQRDRT